jgi:hypothetical protein
LLVFFSFFTCRAFEPEDTGGTTYTNVEYSEDGNTVTIYFDGSSRGGGGTPGSNRALSKNLAITAHDYFEVTFYYRNETGAMNSADSYITARGEWELGQSARISGVYRTEEGVNYGVLLSALGHTGGTETTANAGIVTIPDPDMGSAILIAGKKSDKTILAVGALSAVDGFAGLRTIKTNTKSVSFALNALRAGAFNIPISESSFYTNANSNVYNSSGVTAPNTLNTDINIGFRTFPLFRFRMPTNSADGDGRRAHYLIRTHSSINGLAAYNTSNGTSPAFTDFYRRGIIQASNGTTYIDPVDGQTKQKMEKIRPQYTPPNTHTPVTNTNDDYHYNAAGETVITLRIDNQGNGTRTALFMNPIRLFPNHTNALQGEIFAITFQIPVFAFSTEENPVMWFIRPGYDNYRLELDDGSYGNGGAVLCGVGDFAAVTPTWYLKLSSPPEKMFYNNVSGGYNFNLTGISVQFMGNNQVLASTTFPSPNTMVPNYYIDMDNNGTLTAGDVQIYQGTNISTILGSTANREVTIIVEYNYTGTPGGGTYYASFVINVSDLSVDFSTIDPARRFVLSNDNDLTQALNYMNGKNGAFLWVLTRSFDISQRQIDNTAGGTVLVITALKPGITLGRRTTGTGAGDAYISFLNDNVLVFFGKWPFNTPIMVGGEILHDESYSINTTGPFAGGGGAPGAMFRRGGATTAWEVRRGPEMTAIGTQLND